MPNPPYVAVGVPFLVAGGVLFVDIPGRLARRLFPRSDYLNARLGLQVTCTLAVVLIGQVLVGTRDVLLAMTLLGAGGMCFHLVYEWATLRMQGAREQGIWAEGLETRYSLALLLGYVLFFAAGLFFVLTVLP